MQYVILAYKVLANRLKRILPFIISETHSAFVTGRQINNVLVVTEIINFLHHKILAKK